MTTVVPSRSDFIGQAKIIPPNPGVLFLPFQDKWIRDNSRIKLMEKSRQIGISWTSAYRLVRQASLRKPNLDTWVSSRDAIQAKLFLEDCKHFAKKLNKGAKDLGRLILDEEKKISAFVLELTNGLRIHSLSSNPDAQAGKRGTRLLDEAALHKDLRLLYSIAYPGITWGGNLEMVSTHRGSQNFFNGLVQDAKHGENKRGVSLHTVTLQDALDQGFLYKLQQALSEGGAESEILGMDEADYFNFIKGGCADEEQFLQEYMCVPSDDATAFLTYELIDGVLYPLEFGNQWQIDFADISNPLYIGVDVGRNHDLTVIWILEKWGDTYQTRRVIEMQGETFSHQESVLWPLLALPQVKRCCIDATGLGAQFAERAKEKFGHKVEEVKFTLEVKADLAYPLKAACEDKTIRIPNEQKIISDLRAIKKETTAAGNIRFAADRGTNGHADRFWACALGLHAGKTAKDIGGFHRFQGMANRFTRGASRKERKCA